MVHLLPFTFYLLPLFITFAKLKSVFYKFSKYYRRGHFERVKKQRGNIGQYAKEAHGYFAFPKLEGEIGPRMMFRGKKC